MLLNCRDGFTILQFPNIPMVKGEDNESEIVGHISNLRMLPAEANRSKGARSDIELEELLAAIEEIEQEKV